MDPHIGEENMEDNDSASNDSHGNSSHGNDQDILKSHDQSRLVDTSDAACSNKDENEKENNKDSLGVKVKRKGRRGRSSGSLTMKGDKITSFTTERGITYSPNGKIDIFKNKLWSIHVVTHKE